MDRLMSKSVAWLWELMFTRPLYQTPDMARQGHILAEIARLLDEGRLRHTMTEHGGVLSAATLRQAHARLESGQMIGKLVFGGDRKLTKDAPGRVRLLSSSGRTRTYNLAVNSRPLCRLSYRGIRRQALYAR
jgi:hypothetical protein